MKKVILKNGKVLVLRAAMSNDAEKIIEYLNVVGGESDNLLFGNGEFRLSVEQERKYIESLNNSENILMLIGLIDDEIVSVSQISSLERKRIAHNSELAISVKKKYWGMGIGREVMDKLIQFARDSKITKTISLGVRDGNDNAINLYKKFGFEKVGYHKNYFNINGKYYDEILMDLYI